MSIRHLPKIIACPNCGSYRLYKFDFIADKFDVIHDESVNIFWSKKFEGIDFFKPLEIEEGVWVSGLVCGDCEYIYNYEGDCITLIPVPSEAWTKIPDRYKSKDADDNWTVLAGCIHKGRNNTILTERKHFALLPCMASSDMVVGRTAE